MEENPHFLDCQNGSLTKLIVSDHITHVWCAENKLEFLEVPNTIEFIDCSNNCLEEIHVRNGDLKCLYYLDVRNNKLKSLPKLPRYMSKLLIGGNPESMIFQNLNFMFGPDGMICRGDFYDRIGVGGIGADEFTAYDPKKLLPLEMKWIYGEDF